MRKARIVILSGPSGSGKTSLYKKLLASRKFRKILVKSISVTTRERRPNERHSHDYFFVSKRMFEYKKRAGHFMESQNVFGQYYGTPKQNVRRLLKSGVNVLLCIDVKGAKQVMRQHKNVLKVFVKTPTFRDLQTRLKGRKTEKSQDLSIRLQTARKELREQQHYDYVIINDQLEKAYRRLAKLFSQVLLV